MLEKEYRPFKNTEWEKIKASWDFYRDQIGLEGEILEDVKDKDQHDINEIIRLHRIERNENIQAYYDLKYENK